MPQKRIYLYVPFKDKEKVKSLGAMWDDKEKKWFAPKSLDKNIFHTTKKNFHLMKVKF